MITLVANTVAKIVSAKPRNRYLLVMSDSATATRIAKDEATIDSDTGGIAFFSTYPIVVLLEANKNMFVKSAGTPSISAVEIISETAKNVVIL